MNLDKDDSFQSQMYYWNLKADQKSWQTLCRRSFWPNAVHPEKGLLGQVFKVRLKDVMYEFFRCVGQTYFQTWIQKSLPLPLLEVNVTEAKTEDFSWFSENISETVPPTELSIRPVVLVMTVGFKEDSKFNVIDDSAAVANGGDEDILAVGNIEFRFSNEFEAKLEATEAGTEVKANGVNDVFGFSAWLSDIVDELEMKLKNEIIIMNLSGWKMKQLNF